MTMQITIDVPNQLGRRLQRFKDRLPEVLEQGLRAISDDEDTTQSGYHDEQDVMVLLASQPTPDQVLAIRPSAALQQRMSELLERNKISALNRTEEAELDRYLTLEHLVRLAKAYAYRQVQHRS
jgi:hypothetical protein